MNPVLRKDLEFIPIRYEGKAYVLVRDPWELVPEGKLLPLWLFQLLTLWDGSKSERDIQFAVMEMMGGSLVPLEEILTLISRMEEDCLLESERVFAAIRAMKEEYMRKEVREPASAGKSYPEDPEGLKAFLGDILGNLGTMEERPKAVIAPHIDLRVGKRIYKSTYQRLSGSDWKNVLILGVGHQMERGIFSVTTKDFQTPLGLLRNLKEVSEQLLDFGDPITGDEIYHRTEHSIEFQTLFLRYLFPEREIFIIPILCGPVTSHLEDPTREAYLGLCGPFIESLRGFLAQAPETLILAGVDLSHVGPKFGDPYPAHILESATRAHDNTVIQALVNRDATLLWETYRSTNGRYKVCGFSALALFLELLGDGKGELVGYEFWHEQATQSAVSFAGLVYG